MLALEQSLTAPASFRFRAVAARHSSRCSGHAQDRFSSFASHSTFGPVRIWAECHSEIRRMLRMATDRSEWLDNAWDKGSVQCFRFGFETRQIGPIRLSRGNLSFCGPSTPLSPATQDRDSGRRVLLLSTDKSSFLEETNASAVVGS